MISATRRAIHLAAVSAAARTPAFVIPIVIAAVFGAGQETDAYFIAYAAVLFLGGTLAQGVEHAVVPFAALEIQRNDGAPRTYLDRAARRVAAVAILVWIVGAPLVSLAASPVSRGSVLRYAMCLAPLAVAWCISAVFSGALVSQWRIATATGSLLWRGAGALLGLSVVPLGGGLWSVALGLGVGEAVRIVWLRLRLGSSLPADAGSEPSAMGPLGRAAAAQVGASAAIGAAPVVERLLAVSLGVGAVSHLEYATRLLVIPAVMFEGALAPLLLARWTEVITREGRRPARDEVFWFVGKGILLAAAVAAVLFVVSPTLVRLLLGHGRFSAEDEASVSSLLRLLSLAFVATMGALLLERLYLASRKNHMLAGLSMGRALVRILTVWTLLPSSRLLAFPIGYAVADWCYLLALFALLGPITVGAERAASGS